MAGPQQQAYLSLADELFYGGSAGGGKTDLALGIALTAHRKSIIFRREYPMLKGIEERAIEILGGRQGYNQNEKTWRLGDGAVMEFGAVQYLDDREKYMGRPHDLIVFDEITHFLEAQYRFLIAWNRTADPDQRCRVVCTGNPPTTPEGEWVIEYWGPWLDPEYPSPAKPGELRWFATIDGKDTEMPGPAPVLHHGERISPKSRSFIPARVEDNPFLMASGYKGRLQALPEELRVRFLDGQFIVKGTDHPWQVIPTAWVELAQQRWKDGACPHAPIDTIGVDPARGGKDKTALARRIGTWIDTLDKHEGSETPDGPLVAALVVAAMRGEGYANVDAIGIGSSVYDALKANGVPANALNSAAGSKARDKTGKFGFANKRAEWYWKLREALDPESGQGLALPPDRELKSDLCAPRYKLGIKGIQVEPKEDVKERIGRSPDCGDAVVYAFAMPDQPPQLRGYTW